MVTWNHGHGKAVESWFGCRQHREGREEAAPGRRGTLMLGKTLVEGPACSAADTRTLQTQNVLTVKAKGLLLFPSACRKDRSCSVLCCASDLPSPNQLSPEGGFLAGSCQELLAITSRCPSMQLLKTADGDVGCSCARPVALQAWFRISPADASSSIYTQSSHSLLEIFFEVLV